MSRDVADRRRPCMSATDCELWVFDFVDPAKQRRLTDHGGGPAATRLPPGRPTASASPSVAPLRPGARLMVVDAAGVRPRRSPSSPPRLGVRLAPGSQLLILGAAQPPALAAVDASGAHARLLASGAGLTAPAGARSRLGRCGAEQADGSTDIVTVDGDGGHAEEHHEHARRLGGPPLARLSVQPGQRRRPRRTRAFGPRAAAPPPQATHPRRRRPPPPAPLYVGHTNQRPRRYGPQRLPDNEVSFSVAAVASATSSSPG